MWSNSQCRARKDNYAVKALGMMELHSPKTPAQSGNWRGPRIKSVSRFWQRNAGDRAVLLVRRGFAENTL